MRIGILQTDSVLEQFQPSYGNYPEMFATLLTDAADELGQALSIVNFDVEHGEYPASPSDCDGYVITGSKKSVYDDEPWIAKLIDYVRLLDSEKIQLVGICFGHQLVAEALGGKTLNSEKGWGVGIHDSEIVEQDWFMAPLLSRFSLIVSHKDQVVDLPEGAKLLASSSFCPNSMYCVDDHILCMQGHPEFARAYSADLMEMRHSIIGHERYERGVASLKQALSRSDIAKWMVRFLKGKSKAL